MSDLEAAYRAGEVHVYPGRVTAALDAKGLYGPQVDTACLASEPAVDEWEAGKDAPTWEQLVALADLTGMLPEWFTRPIADDPGGAFICQRSGRGRGCHVTQPRAYPPPYTGPQQTMMP